MCNGINHESFNSICPDDMPEYMKILIPDLYKQYDEHVKKAKDYEKEAIKKAMSIEWVIENNSTILGKDLLPILTSVPGIGNVTALVWIAEIVTPVRFKLVKQISAYCGCDPSLKVSAGKLTSHVKRKGNEVLHGMLLKAASALIQRRSEPIGKWTYSIYKRHAKGGWKKACFY
ncbi:IS110 family transposase [Caloramator mitchellensis]|nr:IS110 family transposase [Caloramator mitchellensis]